MKRDHHMRRKGELWFFQIAIPNELRSHFAGKKVIERSLGTKDPAKARQTRDVFLVDCRVKFEKLRKADVTNKDDQERRVREAEWKSFTELQQHPQKADEGTAFDYALMKAKNKEEYLGFRNAYELFNRGQRPAPLVSNERVDAFLDEFLEAKDFSAAHTANTRRAITKLMAWLQAQGIDPILGNVTRELAGDYLSQAGGGPKTRTNSALMLSSYFAWLVNPRAKLEANFFEGLSSGIEKVKQTRIRKRPYTDEELALLLANAPRDLSDAIRVLALSGMRASELCSMTVADCRGDIFRVHGGPDDEERRGKTIAAKREIPVHIDLGRIIDLRRKGRLDSELLFPQWSGKSRSLGKRFHEHRVACGVDDRKKGQKQSKVDMHSLRRWFAAKAMAALAAGATGFTPWTLADVLGHDRETLPLPMTGKYAHLSPIEQRRSCVNSVILSDTSTSSMKMVKH